MNLRALRLATIGALCAGASSPAQVALNMTTNSDWVAVTRTRTPSEPFIDYNTYNRFDTSSSPGESRVDSAYNLVGGSSTSSGASLNTNSLFQIQTGYVGGATEDKLGVAFRLRLGSYDLGQVGLSGGLTTLVGIGSTSSADKATFLIGASIQSSGAWSIFVIDGGSANGTAKVTDWNTGSGYFAGATKSVFATGPSINTSFFNYGATLSDGFNSSNDSSSNDGWLTFGITFASVNALVSSTSRVNNTYDAATTTWNYSAAVYAGVDSTNWVAKDWLNHAKTDTVFSDFIYTNGGMTNPVPEPSTYLMVGGMIFPAYLIVRHKRRRQVARLA